MKERRFLLKLNVKIIPVLRNYLRSMRYCIAVFTVFCLYFDVELVFNGFKSVELFIVHNLTSLLSFFF